MATSSTGINRAVPLSQEIISQRYLGNLLLKSSDTSVDIADGNGDLPNLGQSKICIEGVSHGAVPRMICQSVVGDWLSKNQRRFETENPIITQTEAGCSIGFVKTILSSPAAKKFRIRASGVNPIRA